MHRGPRLAKAGQRLLLSDFNTRIALVVGVKEERAVTASAGREGRREGGFGCGLVIVWKKWDKLEIVFMDWIGNDIVRASLKRGHRGQGCREARR
jgi:hypothetical protein